MENVMVKEKYTGIMGILIEAILSMIKLMDMDNFLKIENFFTKENFRMEKPKVKDVFVKVKDLFMQYGTMDKQVNFYEKTVQDNNLSILLFFLLIFICIYSI